MSQIIYMKKKTARPSTNSKKTLLNKARNKKTLKKSSSRSWLIGLFLALVAVAAGAFFMQPKSLKVLEIAGTIEDYLEPNPIDINQLVSSKTPKSDIPELNAAAAAVQAKKAGLSESAQKQAAKKAAEDTIRQNAEIAVRQKSKETDPEKIEKEKQKIITDAQHQITNIAPTIAEKAMEAAAKVNVVIDKDGNANLVPVPGANSPVTQGGSCTTSGGMQVLSGSTVIGDVEKTEGENYNKNKVYECRDGSWKFTERYCGTGEAMLNCDITLKPTYALDKSKGEGNCYQGNTLIGHGQVTDTEDGKKQCQGGSLVAALQLNGKYLSDKEYKAEIAKLQNNCVTNGGTWNSDQNICGVGEKSCERDYGVWNHTTRTCDYASGEEERCIAKGSGYEYIKSTKECRQKDASSGRTEVCQAQGTTAVCRVYDENRNLITSRQANTEEDCTPQGTQTKCIVYTFNAKGEKVRLRDYIKSTTGSVVNPSGKYQNGELTYNESDCRYGGESTGIGSSQGAQFRCKDSTGSVPRTFDPSATRTFGENPNSGSTSNPYENQYDASGHRYEGVDSADDCDPSWEKFVSIGSTKYCNRLSSPMTENGSSNNAGELNQSDTDEETDKKVGDSCQNTWIANTCKKCPNASFSKITQNGRGAYMCGTLEEVKSIVTSVSKPSTESDLELRPSGENPYKNQYGADNKRYVDNPEECDSEWEQYNSIGSSKFCTPIAFPSQQQNPDIDTSKLSITDGTLPSTMQTTLAGAGVWGTAGAITGAAVCGGTALLFGSLTFGGTIVLAPTAAATCATWGAGVGALIGGSAGYISNPPDNPAQPSVDTQASSDDKNPHQDEYGADNKRYVNSPDECKSQWEEYGSIGSTQYCKPKK